VNLHKIFKHGDIQNNSKEFNIVIYETPRYVIIIIQELYKLLKMI